MILSQLIERHAQYRGQHVAVVFEGRRLNYRSFYAEVTQLAQALLNSGIGKGDRVATLLPNCLELLTLYWATASIGAVVVPLSPLLQVSGIKNLLQNSGSILVFLPADKLTELSEPLSSLEHIDRDAMIAVGGITNAAGISYMEFLERSANREIKPDSVGSDDIFNIIYSSGTTGTPKGIVHTHMIRAMYAVHFACAWRMTPESVVLQAGSIVFNGSFLTLMPSFFLGCTYILHRQFDAASVIDTIESEGVTHMMMVPSQIIALLEHRQFDAEKLSSLEMILSVGAPLHQRYKDDIRVRLPGRFYELYGLTEGFVTVLDKTDFERKTGSVGCPPPMFEIDIRDESDHSLPPGEIGEIVGRGPILMKEYHGQPEKTREAIQKGWLHSGDMGYLDEQGYLYLVDRKKDMIISGGVNVYPRDIEEVVLRHTDVLECAVFGVASDKWGETPVAAVRLQPGSNIDLQAIRDWVNQHVHAKFQRISDIIQIADFPKNVAGKILKHELLKRYEKKR